MSNNTYNDRFMKIYKQNTVLSGTEIWADRETGVCYLWHADGYADGLTPLLDRDGKPLIASELDGQPL